MIMASTNNFMHNTELTEESSFTHLIDFINPNEENEIEILDNSTYYIMIMILKYHYRKATMVSLNYQSINAKFDH